MSAAITSKKVLPDIQLFTTDNKARTFYFSIIENYPESSRIIKVTRTSHGYDLKEVSRMTNVNVAICLGYHYDYLSLEEINVIEEYLNNNYLAKNLVKDLFDRNFNRDDIPF